MINSLQNYFINNVAAIRINNKNQIEKHEIKNEQLRYSFRTKKTVLLSSQ